MKTKLFLSIIAIGLMLIVQGQKITTDVASTSFENDTCQKFLEERGMINKQRDYMVDYSADTVLLLDYAVEIAQTKSEGDEININPNAQVQTSISMFVPETDYVCIKITDMQGRTIISSRRLLEEGTHIFKYNNGVGDASYFTAYWHGQKSILKIEHSPIMMEHPISLEYIGNANEFPRIKNMPGSEFNTGDTELYSGKEKGL